VGTTAVSDTTLGVMQIIVIVLAGIIILSVAWESFRRRK
jgi:hypothetical protein